MFIETQGCRECVQTVRTHFGRENCTNTPPYVIISMNGNTEKGPNMILDGPRAEIAPTLPVECQGQDLYEIGVAAALLMNNDKLSEHRSNSGVSKGHYDFDIVTDEAGRRLLIVNPCKYIEYVEIKKRRVQRTIDKWLPLLFAA